MLANKSAIEQLVILVTVKECLVIWVEVNEHEAWILWDSESTTSGFMLFFAHAAATSYSYNVATWNNCAEVLQVHI